MISRRWASLIILAAQLLLLAGVGGKYGWDRRTYPHLWLKAQQVDPDSLTRGRYLLLRVQNPRSTLIEVVPLFVPEHAKIAPSLSELYVEVTVPPSGPLRALQLGTLQDGHYLPLDIH